MPQVEIMVNGRAYLIACEEGQELHLGRLGRLLDGKVAGLAKAVGQVGDARLLVMAGLIIADELHDAEARANQLRGEAAAAASAREQARAAGYEPPVAAPAPRMADETIIASVLGSLAERIDSIAAELEGS